MLRFHIQFFYEGKPTALKGNMEYVVASKSAALEFADAELACIEQDHENLCQFEDTTAPGFSLVVEAI